MSKYNTTEKIINEPDRNSLTFSIPRALIPIPILSFTERMIISVITSLSSKYSDKGGCTLTNEALAERHECSTSTVSTAISKATWLGMLQCREDSMNKHKNKDGTTSVTQRRRIKLVIPEIWTYFGEVWADFYFKGDEDSKKIIDWMKNYITKEWKNRKSGEKLDLILMIKRAYEFFSRGGLENPKAPFINSEGSLREDSMLYIFTKVDFYESRFLRNKYRGVPKNHESALHGKNDRNRNRKKANLSKTTSPNRSSPIPPKKFNPRRYILDQLPDELSSDRELQRSLLQYIKYRKEIGKPIKTERMAKMIVNRLKPHSVSVNIRALTKSIECGWTGIFPESIQSNHVKKRSTPINTCGSRAFQDDDDEKIKYPKGEVFDVTKVIKFNEKRNSDEEAA